jgi:SAM-dependent methyltransferase
MSESTTAAAENSSRWWDDYFAHHWEGNDGRGQTAHFAEALARNLPPPERAYLASDEATVLDWGCACGDGVDVLSKAFAGCRVAGLDHSQEAIARARQAFPDYEFRCVEDGAIETTFDVVVTSNCLEHFTNPSDLVRNHLRSCRAFYVALVPYREPPPLCEGHVVQLSEDSFPDSLDGFTRVAAKVIEVSPKFWCGPQLLVVYASPAYLQKRAVAVARMAELEDLRRQLSEARSNADSSAAQLKAITSSRTWKVAQMVQTVRLRLLPLGSRREAAAKRISQSVLKPLAQSISKRLLRGTKPVDTPPHRPE